MKLGLLIIAAALWSPGGTVVEAPPADAVIVVGALHELHKR